jgi:hypothetical protein
VTALPALLLPPLAVVDDWDAVVLLAPLLLSSSSPPHAARTRANAATAAITAPNFRYLDPRFT